MQLYMKSIDDQELITKLREVSSGADQAALLTDLGNLHLAEARLAQLSDTCLLPVEYLATLMFGHTGLWHAAHVLHSC